MKKIMLAIVTAVALAVPGIASASDDSMRCAGAPMEKWMTADKIAEQFKADGYEVRKVKPSGSCYEVYAMKDGKRLEMYVDPVSGKVVKTELK